MKMDQGRWTGSDKTKGSISGLYGPGITDPSKGISYPS